MKTLREDEITQCINMSEETRHVASRSMMDMRWTFAAYTQYTLDGSYACTVICYH